MKQNRTLSFAPLLCAILIIAFAVSPGHSFSRNALGYRVNTVAIGQGLPASQASHRATRDRRHAITLGKDGDNYDPFNLANKIDPETKPLLHSAAFYARFVLRHYANNKMLKKTQVKVKGKRRAMWRRLDEQRKNVMTLAGYTSHIVVPSFTFLFFGALMASVVPSYYSKCIQCVSTLTASRAQVVEAVVGLGITSTLAALFTGLRGALFWIGGE
jgi:hypothetical protein